LEGFEMLTVENRANLEKLATYLEGLPADYSHFNMALYLAANSRDAAIEYALRNGGVPSCGTVACAVGHGPAAGIFMPSRLASQLTGNFDSDIWCEYSIVFLGASYPGARYPDGDLFDWVFGGDWDEIDNHHYGAAARIRASCDGRRMAETPLGGSGRSRTSAVPAQQGDAHPSTTILYDFFESFWGNPHPTISPGSGAYLTSENHDER
jgi:hypothetical protein